MRAISAISIALWGAAIVVAVLTFQKVYAADTLIERNKIHNANKKKPAAGCFIPTKQGVVVVINKRHNDIQLPMGKVDTGEQRRKTARRETLEESGIDVIVMQLIYTAIQDRRIYLYHCKPIHRIDIHGLSQTRDFETIILNPNLMVDQNSMVSCRHSTTNTRLRKLYESN